MIPTKILRASTERIYQIDFSPDGKRLAVGSWLDEDSVSIWDVDTGVERMKIPQVGDCRAVHFSPDGAMLLTMGKDHVPMVWDARSAAELGRFRPQLQPLCADVTFCPNSKQLVTHARGGDVTVWEWNAPKWKQVITLPGPEKVTADGVDWVHYPLAASPDGKWLAAGSPTRFKVWETAAWKEITSKATPASWLAFAPDGRAIFTGAHEYTDDRMHSVARWQTETGELQKTAPLASRGPWAVYHLSVDGKTLYTMACDPAEPSIHLYDADTFEERFLPRMQ
jgi:hypothetical protein